MHATAHVSRAVLASSGPELDAVQRVAAREPRDDKSAAPGGAGTTRTSATPRCASTTPWTRTRSREADTSVLSVDGGGARSRSVVVMRVVAPRSDARGTVVGVAATAGSLPSAFPDRRGAREAQGKGAFVRSSRTIHAQQQNEEGVMPHHRILSPRRFSLAATWRLAVSHGHDRHRSGRTPEGSSSVGEDTLTVIGTAGTDQLTLRLAPVIRTPCKSTSATTGRRPEFRPQHVQPHPRVLAQRQRRVHVDQINGAFADEALTVDAAAAATTRSDGGDGNERCSGAAATTPSTATGRRHRRAGFGDDTFIWDPGDGSDAFDGAPDRYPRLQRRRRERDDGPVSQRDQLAVPARPGRHPDRHERDVEVLDSSRSVARTGSPSETSAARASTRRTSTSPRGRRRPSR